MKLMKNLSIFLLALVLAVGIIQKPTVAKANETHTAFHTIYYYYPRIASPSGVYSTISSYTEESWSTGYPITPNEYVRIDSETLYSQTYSTTSDGSYRIEADTYKVTYTERTTY